MRESLQIEIATPCGENWEAMARKEEGRFCQHCQKTVVDFMGMSDQEISRYFTDRAAGEDGGVCGRFAGDQLGRALEPAVVQRNGWSGWRWVLASMLMLVKPSEGKKPEKAVSMEWKDNNAGPRERSVWSWTISSNSVFSAIKQRKNELVKSVVRSELIKPDSARGPVVWRIDPRGNESNPQAINMISGFLGGVSVSMKVRIDSNILQKVADTVSALTVVRREDFVTLYPNPIDRGEPLQLAWLSARGRSILTLLNIRGQVIGEKAIDVVGEGQVDHWLLPVELAAGVYVVRIVTEGKVNVREVVVR